MKNTNFLRSTLVKRGLLVAAACAGIMAGSAQATRVQFQTVMGDFEVNLYDKGTPKTVENFLKYVNAGAYTNTIVHRAVAGFVVQGGGYKNDATFSLVTKNPTVINEPVYSNKRGTIAMAKLKDQPNSASNEWFFNLADNSANLDVQNGGFTVFGQVTGNGMAIIDAMAALDRVSFNKAPYFEALPVRNYTATDAANAVPITDRHTVGILAIVVLDASPDTATAANLNPAKNTLINQTGSGGSSNNGSGGGGGGAFSGWLSLFLLLSIAGFARIRGSRQ
jgi:peptidyl-prolyl cis-trans isomerase A (cyclophilin A)